MRRHRCRLSPGSSNRNFEADPLGILFDRADENLPVLCRGEAASGLSFTLAIALFRLTAGGVSLEVFHGPSREPVFTAATELASAS
jgi:hypothetical protein